MVFQTRTYAVLLVSAGEKFNDRIRALLPVTDCSPIDTAHSVGEARRCFLAREYDLVLINAPLPDEFGSELAADVSARSSAGVLLFVRSDSFDEVAARMTGSGVLTLAKPSPMNLVEQALRMLRAMRERLRRLEERQLTVEERIEGMRMVSRAKWLLIGKRGMSEEEAHRYIGKTAMDRSVSARTIAEEIITGYEQDGAAADPRISVIDQ